METPFLFSRKDETLCKEQEGKRAAARSRVGLETRDSCFAGPPPGPFIGRISRKSPSIGRISRKKPLDWKNLEKKVVSAPLGRE